MVKNADATGRLRAIYDDLIAKRGKLADVHTIQSLRPESIVKHMDLYLEIMFSKSDLSRAEREMIAVVVSVNNGCAYCQMHHGAALEHYWRDPKRVGLLKVHPAMAALNDRENALCVFARDLTHDPAQAEETNVVAPLRAAGLTDSAILDATLVVAYFNFVNRIVLALGVGLEEDQGDGYNY